jgi:hypothetical protein
MRTAIPALALLALGACGFTEAGDTFRQTAAVKGAAAMDEGLVNAEWWICNAASVGSIQRRYGKSPEMAAAWRQLCLGGETTITVPLAD